MYLLAQFFRQRHGKTPDWELKELTRTYEDIRVVNKAFAKRLATIQTEDASLNAMVRLDTQAGLTWFSIAEQRWKEIEHIFRPYYADEADVPTARKPHTSPTANAR